MVATKVQTTSVQYMIRKKQILWLMVLLVISGCCNSQAKKRACIIGAGLSGLVSAKQLAEHLENVEPIVFERGTDIGGQWKYTDSTIVDEHGLPVHSSMYKYLRTNGPKVLMTIPDYPEFHGENHSYVKHETVLEYLRNYTEKFNLRQYIKLDTLVEKVSLISDDRWLMTTRNLNYNKIEIYKCDYVMVCNGRYSKPYIPTIPGLDTFTGRTLHSHAYRKPEEFTNQTVVILGASYSGIDIGLELSKYAKRVYLSHRHEKIKSELPKNMIQIPGVVAANGSDLILSEGSRVSADAFVMCTGYLYDFPFLDDTSDITLTKGKYVHPLYKQFVNINHPTMVFVAVPQPSLAFRVCYAQARYFVSLISGKANLPKREIMLKQSQLPPGTPVIKAHDLNDTTIAYYDDFAKNAGIKATPLSIIKLFEIYSLDTKDVMHFKDHELFIDNDGRVVLIKSNNTIEEYMAAD